MSNDLVNCVLTHWLSLQLVTVSSDGNLRTLTKVAIPASPNIKGVSPSLASAGGTPVANKTYLGAHRIFMTKGGLSSNLMIFANRQLFQFTL